MGEKQAGCRPREKDSWKSAGLGHPRHVSQEVKEVNLADQRSPGIGNSSPGLRGNNLVPVRPAKFTIVALLCNPCTQEAGARRS